MRILAFAHGIMYGGAQAATLEFFNLLKGRAEITVAVCDNADMEFLRDVELTGLPIVKLPCRVVRGYPYIDISHIKIRNDVVWITDEILLIAPMVKKIKKVPLVAHLHSYALVCPWWGALYGFREVCNGPCSPTRIIRCRQGRNLALGEVGIISLPRAWRRWVLSFAVGPLDFFKWPVGEDIIDYIDGFITVSHASKTIHLAHIQELSKKLFEVIYNPVIVNREKIVKEENRVLLYASGANIVKGPHIILKALHTLMDMGLRDVQLYMTKARDNPWIEGLVKRLGLREHVVLLPRVPRNELLRLMAGSDVVVMPSLWPEPFGRVPVEANKLGVPAVVSNRGGLPETVVDGVTGIVAEPTPEAFAEAIAKALEMRWDKEAIKNIAEERFNPEAIARQLLEFFHHVVSASS